MARISTYSQDPNLEGQDRVIGSDVSNANATMNFSLASLGDFYIKSGLADATRLGYRFTLSGTTNPDANAVRPGTGYIIGAGGTGEISNVTSLVISATDLNSFETGVMLTLIGRSGIAKIATTRASGGREGLWQGYFDVGEITEVVEGTTIVGYTIPLARRVNEQQGSLRFATGITEPDESFILIPLPGGSGSGGIGPEGPQGPQGIQGPAGPTGATGPVGPQGPAGTNGADGADGADGTNGVDGVGVTSITDTDGDGTATITYTDGTTMDLALPAGPQGPAGPTGPEGPAGPSTSPLAFPTLSGNFEEAGFSGAGHSHTFTLSGTDGFTIDPALANNVATIAQNAIETVTVNPTYTATQDTLMTHVDAVTATRTFTTFRPVYVSVVNNTNPTDLPNGLPTSYTPAVGDRETRRIRSGSTVAIHPGALANPEAIIALSNTDFPSPIFRTGGFLIVTPETTFSVTSPTGAADYTAYVISMTANLPLELEII